MIANKIILILGQKRMGKTTQAFDLVKGERYIFCDPRGQLEKNGLRDVPRTADIPLDELSLFLNGKLQNMAIHTSRHNYPKLFGMLAKMAEAQITLDFYLVVDETQYFSESHFIDPSLEDLVATGGQNKLNMVFIVREAHEVHKFMRSQADDIISFRQVEPASLAWSAKIYPQADVILPKLKRFEFIYLRKLDD